MSTMTHSDVQMKTMWNYIEIEHNIAFSFFFLNILASMKNRLQHGHIFDVLLCLLIWAPPTAPAHYSSASLYGLLPLPSIFFICFHEVYSSISLFCYTYLKKGKGEGKQRNPWGNVYGERKSGGNAHCPHEHVHVKDPNASGPQEWKCLPLIHVQILTMCVENIDWSSSLRMVDPETALPTGNQYLGQLIHLLGHLQSISSLSWLHV